MNESRAKKIRKTVYGDMSQKEPTYATPARKIWNFIFPKVRGILNTKKSGQLLCTGLRAKYKEAKKDWKENLRNGGGQK